MNSADYPFEISVIEAKHRLDDQSHAALLIDVRETHEAKTRSSSERRVSPP